MMINKEFYHDLDKARDAYGKYCALTANMSSESRMDDQLQWAYKSADTALCVDPGKVVQVLYKGAPRYALVKGYSFGGCNSQVHFDRLVLELAGPTGGTTTITVVVNNAPLGSDKELVEELDIRHADVPKGLIDAIAGQFGGTCASMKEKCPFKAEYKEPVPPCMKKED